MKKRVEKPAAKRSGSGLGNPAVLVPIVLVVLAIGYFAYQWIQARSDLAASRAQLLQDIQVVTRKRPLDGDELSRLVAKLTKIEGYATERDTVAAMVRIELARGRIDRAAEMFAPIANLPGATPAEHRLAATVMLRRHELGLPDRASAVGVLEQVVTFAESAYADGQDAADLTTAWLAASRLGNAARADGFAAQLQANHAGSPGAKFAKLVHDFRLEMPREEIDAVRREFDEPPAEIDAMLAMVVLQGGDMPGALALVEPALVRAPGLVEVRYAAAVVFHVCVLSSATGSEPRAGWVVRRDAQFDWLVAQAPVDDLRREKWSTMRAVR